MTPGGDVGELLRPLVPEVLGALVGHYGHFDACEDAVQEALLAAALQWPERGLPDNPRGWLIRVASFRLTDQLRSETARGRRELAAASLIPPGQDQAGPPEEELATCRDDTLDLVFLCCDPALSQAAQTALTLRAVGGLTTAQIARAFLVPETTMAQRITRAKQRLRDTGLAGSEMTGPERAERLAAVLEILYLIFNEGHTATSGTDLYRVDLTREAIRLARALRDLLPGDGEVTGLLALMLLTDARRPARTGPDGALIPLTAQDRQLWDSGAIREGTDLITEALARAPIGPYQLQAAIAAVHAEAVRAEDTDWAQILVLYRMLERLAPGPVVALNAIVAVAMVDGPGTALDLLEGLDTDNHMAGHHRLEAVRGHLLEMAGDQDAARACYRLAARRTTSIPEQRYLLAKATPGPP